MTLYFVRPFVLPWIEIDAPDALTFIAASAGSTVTSFGSNVFMSIAFVNAR